MCADLSPGRIGAIGSQLTQGFYDGKVTCQVNNKHRLIAYYQYDLKHNITGASAFNSWESRFDQHFLGNMTKGEWQGTLGRAATCSSP